MLYEEEALSHVEKEKIIYDAVFSKIIRIFVAKTACNKRTVPLLYVPLLYIMI